MFVEVDSGQGIERLLFDCGDGCTSELTFADLLAVDHLFFSHLHMDHVGGFDSFFRGTFDRDSRPNRVWGPPGTSTILQHRFQGFLWNLHEQMDASWRVSDIHPAEIHTARFELREAFATAHDEGSKPYERQIAAGDSYTVDAITMDHRTPTIAYVVREKGRRNIDTSRLSALGLKPGPWLKDLKDSPVEAGAIMIDGVLRSRAELTEALVVEAPGDSIAYLTDFLLDEAATDRLADVLRGCRTIVCEAQYRHADLALAHKHFHMTTTLSATLAQRAGVGEWVLFHLSSRYGEAEWGEMLREAREVFPGARFPEQWAIE